MVGELNKAKRSVSDTCNKGGEVAGNQNRVDAVRPLGERVKGGVFRVALLPDVN